MPAMIFSAAVTDLGGPTAAQDSSAVAEALWPRADEIGRNDDLSEDGRRQALLALLQSGLEDGRARLRRRFDAGDDALDIARSASDVMDGLIRTALDFATRFVYRVSNPTAAERAAAVALGGYGRGTLAPFSDIDLLFLFPYKITPRGEQIVEFVLYLLWDLGLKVGHATRSVDDCIRLSKNDHVIAASLLEARYFWGDTDLFAELQQRFEREVIAGSEAAFVASKLSERDSRHKRLGDSRYLLEPNIKDGKGGLRDLHTLLWIAKYVYRVRSVGELVQKGVVNGKEARRFQKAETFLMTLRFHLHYLAGRAEERLTFDLQPEIALRMGYGDRAASSRVERFMKHYFLVAKDVGDLTRLFCAAIEVDVEKQPILSLERLGFHRRVADDFVISAGRLSVRDPGVFRSDPANFIRIFRVAQQRGLDLHPTALKAITRGLDRIDHGLRTNAEANRLFVEIVTAKNAPGPEPVLRLMNEAGVFGRFIQDFGRIVAQTQHDMYHVYTVDEHTIRAIGVLHEIECGQMAEDHPLASEIVKQVLSRQVLYLAALFHDIGKGRGGNHSEIGSTIALETCPRLGLDPGETETVAWLVRHHLSFSSVAQKRDINDPKTIEDFVALVQSPERLRLLLVLTVADMRATGPTVFNAWKGDLMRKLYYSAERVMLGEAPGRAADEQASDVVIALRGALADWSDEEFAEHIERGTTPYWLDFDIETLGRHARMVRDAERAAAPLTVQRRIDRGRGATEVTIYTPDNAGLFSKIAGALALAGANVVNAQIHTLQNGMALDTFWLQDEQGQAFDRPDKAARLSALLEQVLSGQRSPKKELTPRQTLPERAHVFRVAPQVLIDNRASDTHTVIEVNGRDRPGLLSDVTRALTEANLQISNAKVSTYGERAVDVFYVKDIFGLKIDRPGKLKVIREKLLAALRDPLTQDQDPAVPPP